MKNLTFEEYCNQSAYPWCAVSPNDGGEAGMTKFEAFALASMQGLINDPSFEPTPSYILGIAKDTLKSLWEDKHKLEKCRWNEDHKGNWEIECREEIISYFKSWNILDDGFLKNNNMNYCCFCGRELIKIDYYANKM